MGKNIVICIDGTADFAAKQPTHVYRLFRMLERSSNQLVYYDGGVGTLRDATALTIATQKLLQGLDLAAATSIQRNFVEALRFLVRHYEKDDQIFLFGFSRGAYTVRALAGAIKMFGIPYLEQENLLPYVWQRFSTFGDQESGSEKWENVARMKSSFGRPAEIRYLGAWDTVSSVGLIKLRTLPQTAKLSAVATVRHAVSIDERRNMFPENLISKANSDHLEAWFAGVHRDVGGGGKPDRLSLSMIPFEWVVRDAPGAGLLFDDSRVSATAGVSPDACGGDNANVMIVLLYAFAGLVPMKWWKQGRGYRWRWLNFWHTRKVPADAAIHVSVKERMACKNLRYRPSNIPTAHEFVP